jgi:hypothetical protein
LFPLEMARDRKELKLTPVEEAVESPVPVIRLESKETLERGKPLRLGVAHPEAQVSTRLQVPAAEEFEIRTHQPGLDSLIGSGPSAPELMESDWGKQATHHRSIPWGWFVLMGLLLAGGAIWSLSRIREADAQADQILVATRSALAEDARADQEAAQLIDRIEQATRRYFETTDPATLASLSRQPERVAPLIARHYQDKLILANPVLGTNLLQPLTLDNRADFWMHSVELQNHETCNVIIEILDSGEPKIDWETFVCHQPMEWDTFARERPTGVPLDFRVYLERDHFFSHEFADASQWNCFRLTALDSEETLFGYVKATDPVSEELIALLNQSNGQKLAVILRVGIPAGLESRRGIVIEKLISPRWIYLDPPDA